MRKGLCKTILDSPDTYFCKVGLILKISMQTSNKFKFWTAPNSSLEHSVPCRVNAKETVRVCTASTRCRDVIQRMIQGLLQMFQTTERNIPLGAGGGVIYYPENSDTNNVSPVVFLLPKFAVNQK